MAHKKNRKLLVVLTGFLTGICLISCGITFQLLTQQCVLWTCAPSRPFTIYDLTLPTTLYPSHAVINPMISFPESPGLESGNISIYWEENGNTYKSIFVIDRFGSEDRAIRYFESVRIWRGQAAYKSHPNITFHSQIANNYEVGCGTGRLGGEYVCDLDARYQEFVISFNASITEQMSEETFEKLVMSLDEQFEDFLSR